MKNIFVLALLFAGAQSIRLHDEDRGEDEYVMNLPNLVDNNDVALDKQIAAAKSTYEKNAHADSETFKTMNTQLDQALRNAEQGEFGRALAVSKLADIKSEMGTLKKDL